MLTLAAQPASPAPVMHQRGGGAAVKIRDQAAVDAHSVAMAEGLFPMLSALLRKGMDADPQIAAMRDLRAHRISDCAADDACLMLAVSWSPQELALVGASADRLLGTALTAGQEHGRDAVDRELRGLNDILAVYGRGAPSRYAQVDGPDMPADSPDFISNRKVAVALAAADHNESTATLGYAVRLAVALLDAHDRGEAIAFDPIDQRYNAKARLLARRVDFSRYPYTALIITGVGPNQTGVMLSAAGKLNVRWAADHFARGEAPFILFSGSAVHPRGTRFVEALEMRRALIERFGIPEEHIIVDPYARHTTTNLRNATRRLAALGIPLHRPALIVTNPAQSSYIESAEFTARNKRDLGYQPGQLGQRLSPTALEFRPDSASLRVDPGDPLDP